jgi:putative hemolysin
MLGFAFMTVWALSGNVQAQFQKAAAATLPEASAPGLGMFLIIIALIALNGLLIGAETAVDAIRPAHLKLAKEKNGRRYERLENLVDKRAKIVAACHLAASLIRLTIALCTFLLVPDLLSLMHDRFGWATNLGYFIFCAAILLVPVGLLHLLCAELIPKSYASTNPIRVGTMLYRLIQATSFLFSIPADLVTSIRETFNKRFLSQSEEETANLAEEEIKTLAETGHETGELEVEEREMLHSVFEFTDTVAREVMTPRVDIDAVPVRSDPTEVAKVIQESGHSRIPLYEETDDQIVGIIHAKDLFGAMLNGKAPNLRSLMRPALFVPENKSLHELLTEMRQSRSQMAVVQDEFGGTAGIVTIEDIVEELVGDIIDEYDVEEPEIVEAAGGWLIDGRAHLDDLDELLPEPIETEEFDTIGGYVFGLFGRQPKVGEQVEADGLRFIIAESDGRRILRLKIEPSPEPVNAGPPDEEE